MNRLRSIVVAIIVVLVAVGSIALIVFLSGGRNDAYQSRTLFAMDTSLDITIQGRDTKKSKADVGAAFALVKTIENRTSRFKSGSDVSAVNRSAGVAPVKVSPETLRLIQQSVKYGGLSGGTFDITIAPIVKLWGFYNSKYRVPSAEEIARTLPLVDYRKVIVNDTDGTVMLASPGMEIDLGGVAKGYAVNAVYNLLKRRGVRSALINFGGAVGALGKRSDGKPWVVGIKSPRGDPNDLAGEIKLTDSFVSTSGDYERFFIKDGVRYCHIFDPRTGYQPRSVMGDTIVGPDAMLDDILSKPLFVMEPSNGLAFLNTVKGYDAVVIDSSGKVLQSPSMSKYLLTLKSQI